MSKRRYTDDDTDESIDEESEFEDEELDFERSHRYREPMKPPHGERDRKPERRSDKPKHWRSLDRRDGGTILN